MDHLRYQPHQAVPTESDANKRLLPESYTDHWDGQHVKLPCSRMSTTGLSAAATFISAVHRQSAVVCDSTHKSELRLLCRSIAARNALGEYSKWALIHHHLSQPLADFEALESAIRHIHARRKHDFRILQRALDGFAEEAEFYEKALPTMTALALEMPGLFAENGVPMLVAHVDKALTLTQREVACLMSAAFFCLFPGRVGKASYVSSPKYSSVAACDVWDLC